MYSKSPCEDYVEAAVKQAMTIHITSGPGDILIFMTGQEEIEATCYALSERMEQLVSSSTRKEVANMLILDEYIKLIDNIKMSLTVDGIYYVINTGYVKMKVYNPRLGMDDLQVFPISQAAADQRAGRSGRTGPGTCYRLYTENAYREEMLPQPVPEIQRSNIGNALLLLKSLKVDNLLDFEFMDPPPREYILNSMYQLWLLGALSNTGSLTRMGSKRIEFPLDPGLAKMLITAEEFSCVNEVLTIVSMLSVPSVFFRPRNQAEESVAAHEKFFVPESDHLTLLNIYRQWEANEYRGNWSQDPAHSEGKVERPWSSERMRYVHLIVVTSCKGLKCATSVEPQWLAESGPMFYTVKDSDTSLLDHKKRHRDEKSAIEEEMANLRKRQEQMDIRDDGSRKREEGVILTEERSPCRD
ncbi:pre-mRNA-splicing factor ATP-dependent RNA helicase DEAH7 [Tanacetum coccineum]